MLRSGVRLAIGAAALLLLTGCTDADGQPTTGGDTPPVAGSPFAEQELRLLVSGASLTSAARDNRKLDRLLETFGESGRNGNALARIDRLLNAPSPKMRGLGGGQIRTALKALKATADAGGGFAGPLASVSVRGQIQQSVDGEAGFYFVPGQPMHMWVQMITVATRGDKTESIAEMYRIEVPANQTVVEARAGANGSVFPAFADAAFSIPAQMAKRDDGTMFYYKLWAVGRDVQVTQYWVDNDYNSSTGPNWTKYTLSDIGRVPQNVRSIFDKDDDACIDMMFVLNPARDVADGGALDAGRLPANAKPPYYCLGRCKNPPVVNTH